jgi:hypothetical protein
MRSLPRFRPILIEKLQEAQNGPGLVSAAAASHYSSGEEQYDTSAGREKMPVSFERDIRPLFRQIDIEHMNKHKFCSITSRIWPILQTITAMLKLSRTV